MQGNRIISLISPPPHPLAPPPPVVNVASTLCAIHDEVFCEQRYNR